MRNALAIVVLLSVPAAAQDKSPSNPFPSKKGDAIAIYGCLRGSSLEATDIGSGEDITPVLQPTTFRLTGDKAVLKDLKEKYEKKVVEIRGVLKSDLQPTSWRDKTIGNTRISIGTPPTGSGSAADDAKRAVPQVEVKSYEGRGVSCDR